MTRTGFVYWPSSRSAITVSKLASWTSVSRQARPNGGPKSSSTKQTTLSGTIDGDDGRTHLHQNEQGPATQAIRSVLQILGFRCQSDGGKPARSLAHRCEAVRGVRR